MSVTATTLEPLPSLRVPKYRFAEPRRNLKTHHGRASVEDHFTVRFSRAYWARFRKIHSGTTAEVLSLVREIPVNGFGITDLLAIAWSQNAQFTDIESFAITARPTVRAFEMKMRSWREAMSQASRYKSFAHQVIAVVPPAEGKKACEYISTFRTIRVGLWVFNPDTRVIQTLYTPRAQNPRSYRYYIEALQKAATTATPALPIF